MSYKVGDKCAFVTSNTRKVGEVVAVVPPGSVPSDVGFPRAGGGGSWRGAESYVVRARKKNYRGDFYGSVSVYWPPVSTLVPLDE